MIIFLITRQHRYTHTELLGQPDTLPIGIWDYETFLQDASVPVATYVFTDIDRLSPYVAEIAARRYRDIRSKLGTDRVLNDPARVMTRFTLLRTLFEAGINGFNAYRVDERVPPARYPVFIRREIDHTPPLSDLLFSKSELDRAIGQAVDGGIPERSLLIVEYHSEPVRPGLFRKLAAFRIGNAIVPVPAGHDTKWVAKGKLGVADEALYQEDYAMVVGNPFREVLERVFDIAHIDYGRADFNLIDGKVNVYEINTNPVVGPYDGHPFAIRIKAQDFYWQRHVQALATLDSGWSGSGMPTPA